MTLEYVLIAAVVLLLPAMGLVLWRAIKGPTAFDRILAANSFGTLVVAFILLAGEYADTAFYLDIALIYVLINFITTIAFLRYFQNQPEQNHAG